MLKKSAVSLLIFLQIPWIDAANMRSYVEGVRARAAVVYFGTVEKTGILARTKFDLKMRADIKVQHVFRPAASSFADARLNYSSYDEKTPALDGGPQYQLQPGSLLLVFADSSGAAAVPAYIVPGSCADIKKITGDLLSSLQKMEANQFAFQEITQETKTSQIKLYENILSYLNHSSTCD